MDFGRIQTGIGGEKKKFLVNFFFFCKQLHTVTSLHENRIDEGFVNVDRFEGGIVGAEDLRS